MSGARGRSRVHAFTLIELLVVIAVVAVLLGLMVPSLTGARDAGRAVSCLSNQRQLVTAWMLYAGDHAGRAMPLGDARSSVEAFYWWGSVTGSPTRVDHERGFLSAYLASGLHARSVYECAAQPWGTYRPQPAAVPAPGAPTSTYGYNGYYLSPAMTPGWNLEIGCQPWKRLADIERPGELLVFADTLLPGAPARNCALLDPPWLFSSASGWRWNDSPTTSFRHGTGACISARADGGARKVQGRAEWWVARELRIGSIGDCNDPAYVPDWRRWR